MAKNNCRSVKFASGLDPTRPAVRGLTDRLRPPHRHPRRDDPHALLPPPNASIGKKTDFHRTIGLLHISFLRRTRLQRPRDGCMYLENRRCSSPFRQSIRRSGHRPAVGPRMRATLRLERNSSRSSRDPAMMRTRAAGMFAEAVSSVRASRGSIGRALPAIRPRRRMDPVTVDILVISMRCKVAFIVR
jgi:hypothetical protein